MTRAGIKQRARVYFQASPGTQLWDDPFAADLWVTDGAREVAWKTDCLLEYRFLGITSGTSSYCAPDLYRLKRVWVKDSAGLWHEPRVYPASSFNFDYDRHNTATGDPPTAIAFQGGGTVMLSPIPSTTRAAAIKFLGYAQPAESGVWVYDSSGVAVAKAETDECPLPVWAHTAVVNYVKWKAAEALGDKRADAFGRDYLAECGRVESMALRYPPQERIGAS